ncbi:aspartate-alanine antiporter [Pseudaminobacter arsenicus]|uniref:Aspartate-alanine antiporter n=1 Tax=Borborobacter arsenicus TaxID=1851146 RepID=A0A432V146_9HYPH|nr:aspartate-alanine antiporter [Pseudaminobacter arsenicus]RUM95772.1 aspartate-alanine antiporter [Pseudaminobacter arsenicus]
MLPWLEQFLVRYPELALYLAIAIGYYIGNIKFGTFSFGPVTGSLFAGIFIGQFAHVPASPMTKSFLFLLFLFGIGYSVGPQFLQTLRRDGLKSVLLALVCTLAGLATAFAVAQVLDLDAGFAAGLLSGALTQSAAMGTATEAIGALPMAEADRVQLVAHVAVADAVCYLFGAVGAIWFCSVVGPKLLNVDLVAEAKELERKLGIERETPGAVSGYRQFEIRAYRVAADGMAVGKSVPEAENLVPQARVFIMRIRRHGELIEVHPGLVLEADDVVAVTGRHEAIVRLIGARAEEVEDSELLTVPFLVSRILLTKMAGKTIKEAANQDWARGLYLRSISRGGVDVPLAPDLALERGDILTLVGPEPVVTRAASHLGSVIAQTTATDFIVLGLAIFLGGLVGTLLRFPMGGVVVSLGTSVGALIAGLVVGHLRTRHPLFGRIPDGAIALMTSLGLAAFVAMTGLHAGPVFISAIREVGIGLLLGGAVVTLTPLLVGLLFGRYVLRMNPVLLLGGIAGALTMTAAMAAVQTQSQSPVAVLGYTPAYPIANILLTLWGTVIVIATGVPA